MGQWWVIFGHFYLNHLSPLWGYFLQFSEHAENFNMLLYSFKHSFSICFQHALQISTCSEIFNTLSNMKIWNIYSKIVTEPIPKYS